MSTLTLAAAPPPRLDPAAGALRPPLALSVSTADGAALAALITTAGAAIPGGCRGVLVGFDAFNAVTMARQSDTRLGEAVEVAVTRLGVDASHFIFDDRLGSVRPGARPHFNRYVNALFFLPAIRRLAAAAADGLLALLVSDGCRMRGSRAVAHHRPGILRISPADRCHGEDILGAVGYPTIFFGAEDDAVLSSHELLDACSGVGPALRFPAALRPSAAMPSRRRSARAPLAA